MSEKIIEEIMDDESPRLRFFFLLAVYGALVVLDAFFLYKGLYNLRPITKLTSIPLLAIWFYANTSGKEMVAANTYQARFLAFAALLFSFMSDVLSLLYENMICYEACLILYTVIYTLFIFLVINMQRMLSEEERYLVHIKLALPAFVLIATAGAFFLWKVMDEWWIFYEVTMVLHVVVLILLFTVAVNAFGEVGIRPMWVYLLAAVLCLLLANLSFGVSDLKYHRIHRILDIPVALGNGLSQALMLFAVTRFVQLKWGGDKL